MNAIMNKTNNGKRLLAAFVAIAMIMCAIAVVAMPSEADDTTTTAPTAPTFAVTPVQVDEVTDLTSLDIYKDGVFTLTADLAIQLNEDVDLGDAIFNLNGHNLKITGAYTLTINHAVTGADDKYIFKGTTTTPSESIVIEDSIVDVTITCATTADYNDNIHILYDVAGIYMDGATLEINQAGTVQGVA